MKFSQITLSTFLLCVFPFWGYAGGAVEKPLAPITLEKNLLDKIYQANKPIETAEIEYCVFDESQKQLSRNNVLWDSPKKRTVKKTVSLKENSNLQLVENFFIIGKRGTQWNYTENRNPDFVPQLNYAPKGTAVSIRLINEFFQKILVFFMFDDDSQGNHICKLMQQLSIEKLRQILEEVEVRGVKCLKFHGPYFMIFEKERGIVLEKTINRFDKKGNPVLFHKVEYFDHKFIDGIWFPLRVQYTFYTHEGTRSYKRIYKIKAENVKLNHKIDEKKFTPEIPVGCEVSDEIENLDYISTGFTSERENIIKKQLEEIFTQSEK